MLHLFSIVLLHFFIFQIILSFSDFGVIGLNLIFMPGDFLTFSFSQSALFQASSLALSNIFLIQSNYYAVIALIQESFLFVLLLQTLTTKIFFQLLFYI